MTTELAKQLREGVQAFYEAQGTAFSETRAFVWKEETLVAERILPGMTVADIGAGNGRFARLLPAHVTYIGIEPSESLRACGLDSVDLRAGGFPTIPLEPDFADVTTCFAVIQHLPTIEERKQAVSELIRITKPGGLLAITSWHPLPEMTKQTITPLPGGEEGDLWVSWKAEGAHTQRYIHDMSFPEWTALWDRPELSIEQVGLFGRNDWTDDVTQGRNWFVLAKKR
ncbi:class I SAM-dependent methyltransferase [Patescibacteria group bacterium]|nr:class I SAM-dependent methyltransferase [Patescibacteria group bacterium]